MFTLGILFGLNKKDTKHLFHFILNRLHLQKYLRYQDQLFSVIIITIIMYYHFLLLSVMFC